MSPPLCCHFWSSANPLLQLACVVQGYGSSSTVVWRGVITVSQDRTSEAAGVVADASKEAGGVIMQKGTEVGEFTKEVAVDLKDAVMKDGEKKRKEEEERKKKGRGPFGLFGRKE